MGGACSMYGGENRRILGFGGETRGKEHLGDPSVQVRIMLRWIFRKWDVEVWAGLCWLMIGTGGPHL